ncbi:hypothetical protein ACTMTJ_16080 [Phytohabitans sp. LJ34]|uniref:hypothetical protein n=1 Tax=Phytohabitans sp. LJ34 TaxID=3452217 RepID=UPI003F8BA04D
MRAKTLFTAVVVAASLAAAPASAGSAAPADPVAPTGCAPTDATGRPIQLGHADNGRTICLQRWQRLYVTLSVDPVRYPNPHNWWTPVQASGDVLVALPLPAPPPPGTTAAAYRATRPGRGGLASYRDFCPPEIPCGAPVLPWRVTVDVN